MCKNSEALFAFSQGVAGKARVFLMFNAVLLHFLRVVDEYSNVGRLFCTPAPPKFTKKLAVDSFFNFGS